MSRKGIPLLCYWDGKISQGPQGITYEIVTPKAIKVNRGVKYSELIDRIYNLIGTDCEDYKLKIICRYLANGQYIPLAIHNDESVNIMLDMTKEKGINCVELYIEKPYVLIGSQPDVQGNEGARDPSYIHFKVRGMLGQDISCRMKPDTPLGKLMTAFSERQQWGYKEHRFIYGGRLLEEHKTLIEYNIRNDSVISTIPIMRGD